MFVTVESQDENIYCFCVGFVIVAAAQLVVDRPPELLPDNQQWILHATEVANDTEYIEEIELQAMTV